MARCGRCGLYNKYPDEHHENKYSGVCLWYQHRLARQDEYEQRDCADFFEAIPKLSPLQHFDYKIKRDSLGDAYSAATRAKRLAYLGLVLSITGLVAKFI
jgi:hypothetical protein